MQTTNETGMQMPPAERLEPVHTRGLQAVFGTLRLLLGWIFLWSFLDKAFALGFSTGRVVDDLGQTVRTDLLGDAAWISGASPTAGAIGFATRGPLAGFFQDITGFTMTEAGPTAAAWIDWVYMLSMLLIGLGLLTGVMTRLAAVGGLIWMAIFYLATAIWPEHNPFVDDHVVEAVVLVGLILANAGRYLGLGRMWQKVGFVKDRTWLY